MKLLGAVPNISEGKDEKLIKKIIDMANEYEKMWVISYKMDEYYNRTLLTVIGKPECVMNYLFKMTEICINEIDMKNHSGAHPAIGSVDVIPIIPITEITNDEAQKMALDLSEKISSKFNIPIFSYENSTDISNKKHINYIRKDGFESLKWRMKTGKLTSDFGPNEPNENAGGCIIGVRSYLITLDFYINSKNRWLAEQIKRELLVEIPGSIFIDKKSDNNFILTLNAKVSDISLLDIYYTSRKVIEHFDCEIEKINIPTPLTSSILIDSFKKIADNNIEGNLQTIEEFILSKLS
ncbi:MAG: glutamate formiminotransferase / 5-formyltetrahydrofolate cyclo-ligase [Oceanotoga sp.]|jgi:glutamate formiminotransferase|uniref:Glutamate formiminotransferase n=1 Tax=Oceanotoga teriensis TaxID=515440 RepID=A0AA45C5G2_9BACT|nr:MULTISPECIES: hypothetical protein [Oceanotoga]MDN5342314.1 glutamate formiminotransferase / 5-formyltetrahydrofolate cyclo-ligase [Oceanotoga sp.]PWJ88767.1 glutamate formiminotransferase [Oceanotoga teriensis]